MQTFIDIISVLSFSGFSRFADSVISKLAFTKMLASFGMTDAIAWIIIIILSIGINDAIICAKNVGRSFILKLHPKAVVSFKYKKRLLSNSELEQSSINVLFTLACELVLTFILSFEAASVSDALMLSAAIIGNDGWLLLLIGKTNLLAQFSYGMQIFICLVLLLCRVNLIRTIKTKLDLKKNAL